MSLGVGEPRHLIRPDGVVSTGWPAVRDTSSQVGIHYDPWQQDLNREMLAKDADGLYAADTVGLSMCRQSGKTYDVGGVCFADSIIHPGTTTVWTAHRFKVARESFDQLRAFARLPQMAPHVDPQAITTAAGNECIPFRNGSRILFAARERGAVRGFAKVRRLVLDEAQILTEAAMADLAPTMNHAWNPQVILMGTPPKPSDASEVFAGLRSEALEGKSEGTLWVEFGADPDCDLDDWEAVARANPSFPLRTSKRAIRRLRKLLANDEDYAREGLGIWDAAGTGVVIDPDVWQSLKVDPEEARRARDRDRKPAFAIDVPPDRKSASIGVAADRRDGLRHVELVERRSGTAWAVEEVVRLVKKHGSEVAVDPSSPAGSLITDLIAEGVEPVLISTREMTQACGLFYDMTSADDESDRRIRHIGQPRLSMAVDAGRKRQVQDAWAWHRRDATSDISPLVAVTLANHLLGKPPKKRDRSGKAQFL